MAKNNKLDMSNLTDEQIAMATQALKAAKDVSCGCGSVIFHQGVKLKQLSRLLTGESQDAIVPIPAMFCVKCFQELSLEDKSEQKPKENVIEFDFRNKK